MKRNYFLLLTLCWTLIAVGCASTDLEAKVAPNTGLDPKITTSLNSNLSDKTGGLNSVLDSNKVNLVSNNKDQGGVENNEINKRNSSEQNQVGLNEDHNENKGKDNSVGEGEKNAKSGDGSDNKERRKEVPVILTPVRKEGSRGEECDISNSCKDDKNALVACLRVPGDDFPDILLLIQNKANGSLSVTISAPDFVQLEKTKVELQDKEDKKVKVSIRDGGPDSLIVLTAGNGNCILDFRDLISLNHRKETAHGTKSTYISIVNRNPIVAFIVFAAILVAASAWMFVSFKKWHFTNNGSKYQKLDIELPVSGGSKVESVNVNDGWDNNWDDNWDDEEAQKTPSMPVTPSLSSKGLASRRLNKEGWKD